MLVLVPAGVFLKLYRRSCYSSSTAISSGHHAAVLIWQSVWNDKSWQYRRHSVGKDRWFKHTVFRKLEKLLSGLQRSLVSLFVGGYEPLCNQYGLFKVFQELLVLCLHLFICIIYGDSVSSWEYNIEHSQSLLILVYFNAVHLLAHQLKLVQIRV